MPAGRLPAARPSPGERIERGTTASPGSDNALQSTEFRCNPTGQSAPQGSSIGKAPFSSRMSSTLRTLSLGRRTTTALPVALAACAAATTTSIPDAVHEFDRVQIYDHPGRSRRHRFQDRPRKLRGRGKVHLTGHDHHRH